VFGPLKGRGGDIGGKTDDQLINDLISIHNAENWLGIDSDEAASLNNADKSTEDNSSTSKIATNVSTETTALKTSSELKVKL